MSLLKGNGIANLPLRLWTCFFLFGDSMPITTWIFLWISLDVYMSMNPKNFLSSIGKLHFVGCFMFILHRFVKVSSIYASISSPGLLLIIMSSTYTSRFCPMWVLNSLPTNCWYVAPMFLRPNDILL